MLVFLLHCILVMLRSRERYDLRKQKTEEKHSYSLGLLMQECIPLWTVKAVGWGNINLRIPSIPGMSVPKEYICEKHILPCVQICI